MPWNSADNLTASPEPVDVRRALKKAFQASLLSQNSVRVQTSEYWSNCGPLWPQRLLTKLSRYCDVSDLDKLRAISMSQVEVVDTPCKLPFQEKGSH